MIADIIHFARSRWESWLNEPEPTEIRHVGVRGGPAHRERAMVMLFGDEASQPDIVLKIAFSDQETMYLHGEFQNLSALYPIAPTEIRDGIPAPLGWDELGPAHVMTIGVVRGRRIVHPHIATTKSMFAKKALETYFRQTFEWSQRLSEIRGSEFEATGADLADRVRVFADRFVQRAESKEICDSFADHLADDSESRWSCGWQHRATDITNALTWRTGIRFVDWEHASPNSEPWFDVAYAPLAIARLGMRQATRQSKWDIFCDALDTKGWVGRRLRSAMEDHWDFPVAIPTGVVLVLMEAALRRGPSGRPMIAELALGLLSDDTVRNRLEWLAPVW